MHSIQLNPLGSMSQLSQLEVDSLSKSANGELYQVFRNCCLAVLYSGAEIDNCENIFEPHQDFDIKLISRERGVKIELINPPAQAFVDGKLIFLSGSPVLDKKACTNIFLRYYATYYI